MIVPLHEIISRLQGRLLLPEGERFNLIVGKQYTVLDYGEYIYDGMRTLPSNDEFYHHFYKISDTGNGFGFYPDTEYIDVVGNKVVYNSNYNK